MEIANVAASRDPEHAAELRKEAYTMALYVAICLLAALLALPDTIAARSHLIGLIWGVTIGLAAAHWFAFRVSARLVGAGKVRSHDLESAGAQLFGAAAVAVLASIPILLLPASAEYSAVQFELAAIIGGVGYLVARRGGASTGRAIAYALAVLLIAVIIAILKKVLAGH